MAKVIEDPTFTGIGAFHSPNDATSHAIVQTTEGKFLRIFI
jgi:hypothetical protein